ncbi:MAG TPA: PAS domain-containing protein, partial [Candidatus Hydrogenedentes bacterium]|nr:PAS domain-containing protein [Candidatus Hydrogenedentota bacterium]
AVREGEEEIGYALATPAAEWRPALADDTGEGQASVRTGLDVIPLDTGLLNLEQVNLLLTHLPVEISFVDDNDEVRYYSDGKERLFPRSPGAIGRKVQDCHPQKSVHIVNRILDEFRAGTRDVAEFWIPFKGRFVQIRYFAVRNVEGQYRGCLEVTQDVTAIRALEGERRLLDWN